MSSIEGIETVIKIQKEHTARMNIFFKSTLISHYISKDENTATVAKDLNMYLIAESETIELYIRISMVLEYKIDKWLVAHWHPSLPEKVESKEDTFGFETLKQKTVALENEITERNDDLSEKNKELEIEAALEKVRSRSLADA